MLKFFTVTEAAKKLRVSRARVWKWIREGRIATAPGMTGRQGAPLIRDEDCRRPPRRKPGPKPKKLSRRQIA